MVPSQPPLPAQEGAAIMNLAKSLKIQDGGNKISQDCASSKMVYLEELV